MKQVLKLLAPYFAVAVFWCVFSNAWLALIAYHVQILLWSRKSNIIIGRPSTKRIMLLALPTALAGPLVYLLLPYITHVSLSVWLAKYHLSGISLLMMIPYFGIIHPCLEQIHWSSLHDSTPFSHIMFEVYHMLVLYSLLTLPWLILCFIVLLTASYIWQYMTRQTGSLALPVLSHVLADFGVVLAAWIIR